MKKLVGFLLAGAMMASCLPVSVSAADVQEQQYELPWEEENIGEGSIATPIPILTQQVEDAEQTAEEDVFEYEPIVHEEVITEDVEFPEESITDSRPGLLPEPGTPVSLSLGSGDAGLWKSLYIEQFGSDYINPFAEQTDGQTVSGNTNRLVIEETDLRLPGKNGLDVVIARQHDNQGYDKSYTVERYETLATTVQSRYIYGFTNKTTNKTIYVGFLAEDHMYTYMYNGCYIDNISGLSTTKYKHGDDEIEYYKFEDIDSYITEDETKDRLEYDSSVKEMYDTIYMERGSRYDLTELSVSARNQNALGAGWELLIPEAYLTEYETELSNYSSGKKYYSYYVGFFRDINGKVHTLEGDDVYNKPDKGDTTYKSTITPDKNKYLKFENRYESKELYEGGPKYNFVVYDSRGLTYYMYNTGLKLGNTPSRRQGIYVVAVKDEYGNMIRYEYDSNSSVSNNVSKIIDTYGREINISATAGQRQISYYDDADDEIKTITYTTETLPASELANDSPIAGKEVTRFKVTNAEGESTIYDERSTEVTAFYYSASTGSLDGFYGPNRESVETAAGYNIERVIYPTGAETHYKYKCVYPISDSTKVRRGVYAVEEAHDVIDGKETNKKTYSLKNTGSVITVTGSEPSAGRTVEMKYDKYGVMKSMQTIGGGANRTVEYTYDAYDNPTQITVSEDGMTTTNTYSYQSGYPCVTQESDGLKTIKYNYYKQDGNLTDKIEKITYNMKSGSRNVEDYHISTELTPDGKSIQYERTVKDDMIKAQKKYEYDSEGNVTAVKQWTSDANGDGILDENDDVITLTNTYTITPKKTKNVTNTFANIVNADGINEGNVTAEYKYNVFGLPLSQKDSYGTETTIEYDDINRPVQYNLPNGGTRTIEYNTQENYVLLTDEAGVVTKQEYDNMGRAKALYRKSGSVFDKIEENVYDDAGRISEKIYYTDSTDGTKEKYTYDALDRVRSKTVYELPNKQLYKETYAYSFSRDGYTVTTATTATGTSAAKKKDYYNIYGQLIKTESISGETTLTTLYENDYQGRVTKQTDPNGNVTAFEYNWDGQVAKQTNAEGDSVTTVYDLAGQAVSVTDANGNTTNTEYDKLGRAVKVITPFDDTVSGETKTSGRIKNVQVKAFAKSAYVI